MILEANRLIADWLADATHGVNAKLATVPLDTGDTVPANIATITDETRSGEVARGDLPATRPCVAVSVDSIQELDGQVVTITADGQLKLRIRIGLQNADTEDAIRDLSYYLRATIASLRAFFAAEPAAAARSRNSIYLESCLNLATATTWAPNETNLATGAVLATIQMRDVLATH